MTGDRNPSSSVAEVAEHCSNPDPLLNAHAAAEYLGLTGVVKHPDQAVRTMARKRQIRSVKVAGKIMFRASWLETYITEHTRAVPV